MKAAFIIPVFALSSATSVGAQDLQTFNCQVARFYSVGVVDDNVVGRNLTLEGVAPPTEWQFGLTLAERKIVIDWVDSPLSLAGELAIFPVGSESYASFHVSSGPCLFVQGNCATSILYSRQSNGSLLMQLQPVATMTFEEDGETEPFPVIVDARCTPTGTAQ